MDFQKKNYKKESGNIDMNTIKEMEIYIRQLEEENLRLKNSNKSLRNNNKALLKGTTKLQRDIYRLRNERDYLKEELGSLKTEESTYAIEFKGNLTAEMCRIADECVPSGMIEEVLPEFIEFHDIKESDLNVALKFISEKFGNPKCNVAREYYERSNTLCQLVYVKKEF